MSWKADYSHSHVQFTTRHMMVANVRGHFDKYTVNADINENDPTQSKLEVEIDVASLSTRDEKRDAHLKGADFFDVAKFPTLTFKSTKVEAAGEGKLKVTGDLTMHGVTKEVVLDVEGPGAPIKDPWGNNRIGVSASTKLNRQDFGVSGGSPMVGDDIPITIDMELTQAKAK